MFDRPMLLIRAAAVVVGSGALFGSSFISVVPSEVPNAHERDETIRCYVR
jgi:hypothetical protein